MEENEIDRDRIVDGRLIPDEYFCPICRCLLWKPRSCASCQNLFCCKCIRTWFETINSGNKCPFRCEPYEDRRCPPYLHSLLARLNIYCRNSSFGCTQVLPYNSLEQHENYECDYRTRQCSECGQLILLSEFNEHREMPGKCVPRPIKCTICQCDVDKDHFKDHFNQCYLQKFNESLKRASQLQISSSSSNGQPALSLGTTTTNREIFQTMMNTFNHFEEQRQLSQLPTNLIGVDAVRQARERRCNRFNHILIMLKFILDNYSKIPFLIVALSCIGISGFGLFFLVGYTILFNWISTHMYQGCFSILLLSYIFSYVMPLFLQFVSDTMIILCFGLIVFLGGCSTPLPLEVFEVHNMINQTRKSIVLCCVGLLIMKIILLFVRFYFGFMPTYLTAIGLAGIHIFVVLSIARYRNSRNR